MNDGARIVLFEQLYNIISAHRNCRRSAADVRKINTIDYIIKIQRTYRIIYDI